MRVRGKAYRTIWLAEDGWSVEIIDQTRLPHELCSLRLTTTEEVAHAIRAMLVRGAPLIGAAAAYGVCLAMRRDPSERTLGLACERLRSTRPTAVNLAWALKEMQVALTSIPESERVRVAYARAAQICEDDVATNRAIGEHGLEVIQRLWAAKGKTGRINVLTHCNAGWLATVDYGTALAPVYLAHDQGIPIHVWVDETRPRNQGASLTAWELGEHGVNHTLIVDNLGGHLMQHGQVDICLVGTDRTTRTGDVCNKVGTYLKALAAHDCGVPFYVCAPSPSIDWRVADGLTEIPIEQRDPDEVALVNGRTESGHLAGVRIAPAATPIANYAFDITPARLVTGFVTERGVCAASREGLAGLFPDKLASAAEV